MTDWNKTHAEKGRLFGEQPSSLVVKALELWKPSENPPLALDIGAYTGRNTLYLARNGFHVTALDPSTSALADLQAQGVGLPIKTVVGTLETYEWKQTMDCIVFANVLHLLTPTDVETALANSKQYTAPNGINVIIGFTTHNFHDQKKVFKRDELKENYRDWRVLVYEEKRANLAAGGITEAVHFIAQKSE